MSAEGGLSLSVTCRAALGPCRRAVGELSAGAGLLVGMERNDRNPSNGRNAVEVRGLVKHYGSTKALDGVDLDVREGTVLGVLGPNGEARPPSYAASPP